MGQKISNPDESDRNVILEEIQSMTHESFANKVQELNEMSQKCLSDSNSKVVFVVKNDTDKTFLWKATVEVACIKVSEDLKIETFRILNLIQFIQVYSNIKCQCSAMQQSDGSGPSDESKITASTLMNNLELPRQNSESQTECIICYERKPDVSLPCAHRYCLQCIEEWNEDHDTCPVCREQSDGPEDSWLLPDAPKAEEINEEIRSTLMNLAKNRYFE